MKSKNAAALVLAVALTVTACGPGALESGGPTATTAMPQTTTTEPATTAPPTTTTTTTTPAPEPLTTVPGEQLTDLPEAWQADGRRYYFPIQPPDAAAYSEYHHDYPATDIFAPIGTTVVAVTDGAIDEMRRYDPWDPAVNDPANRGGRYVSLVGDDGVRYYCSHLDSVAPEVEEGGRVTAGQVIGAIGTSGNAAGTSPHCHFGISHPTFPGDWEVRRGEVWPYDYLQAWTRGEDLTPVLPGE